MLLDVLVTAVSASSSRAPAIIRMRYCLQNENSAHACSEIGLKWFLFALHDLGTALGFVSVLDFSGDFVFLEHRRNGQTGIKNIFDQFRNTHARYIGP
jgi:hypothetical protein